MQDYRPLGYGKPLPFYQLLIDGGTRWGLGAGEGCKLNEGLNKGCV